MTRKLLLATNNKGKIREFRALLAGIDFKLVSLEEAEIKTVVEETGRTFEENARLKALGYAMESGMVTLADDSGLEVEALGGEPGIRSARYAGENASDKDRVDLLLAKMIGIPFEKRTARFKCVIAVATPKGEVVTVDGECQGMIAFEPRGKNGFGYDPVFLFPERGKTMAELPPEVKGQISHRAIAAKKVPEVLSRPPFTNTR